MVLPTTGCADGYYFAGCPLLLESHPGIQGRIPGPPAAGAALTPSLPFPSDVPGKAQREWCLQRQEAGSLLPWESVFPHKPPLLIRFCYCKARPEIDGFARIRAESPLMIHASFSQAPDVSDKYILGLFRIGKSNRSSGFEGRGEQCQALL